MGWNEEDNSKQADSSSNNGANQAPAWLEQLLGSGGQGAFKLWIGIIALIWFLSGIVIVAPAEQVIVKRFGAYVTTYEPGVHWVARGVEQTQRVNVKQVYHFNFKDLMLTKDENIVSVELAVQYQTGDAKSFLFNVRNPELTIKSIGESAMREKIGQTPINPILSEGKSIVEEEVKNKVQKVLDYYKSGVLITQVQLQKADPPELVIESYRDVQRAKTDEQRLRNEAEAYRNDIIPKARGEAEKTVQEAEAYKKEVVAKAEGEAQRFTSVYESYKNSKDVTRERIYLETLEKTLGKIDKIIVDKNAGSGIVPYLPLPELQKKNSAKNTVKRSDKDE